MPRTLTAQRARSKYPGGRPGQTGAFVVAAAVERVLLRAGFAALLGFFVLAFALVLLFAPVLVFVLVLGRPFDLVAFRLLVARAFVREDRVFAMRSR